MASSRITGVADLRRALRSAGRLATPAMAAAMFKEQTEVMSDAIDRTPSDVSTLRGSGTVLPPEISGTQIVVTAGFGGAASAYAVAVHEHLSEHSPPSWQVAEGASQNIKTGAFESQGGSGGVSFSPAGTGPKFLENAFLDRAPRMPRNLAKGVRRALERLG